MTFIEVKKRIIDVDTLMIAYVATFIVTVFVFLNLEVRLENRLGTLYITEIATISSLLLLFLAYLINKRVKVRSQILSVIIGIMLALFFMYRFLTFWFVNTSIKFTKLGYEKESEFQMNQDRYIPLFTSIFDKAEKTKVRKDIDEMIYDLNLWSSRGRKPVYFIRLKDGKIEKLFQSGDIKYESVDTDGEKTVENMLLGKTEPIQYPQYACCGGNDLKWSDDPPFFRLFVPERRYLKDLYSELETILLVRDRQGNIIGAVVDLHGD